MSSDVVRQQEEEWTVLMRAANSGDQAAYGRLLRALAPPLRSFARRAVARTGTPLDPEDIVQETLLALHLKRHTWIDTEPLGPWLRAIARHKVIDALRRRNSRVHVPIDAFEEVLPAEEPKDEYPRRDIERHLPQLPEGQRAVVSAIALEGHSIRMTAARLKMTEGAVRVALHRAVGRLAHLLRSEA
jgi:RNA polymerase sigma-70 factor (ECF subfamily)